MPYVPPEVKEAGGPDLVSPPRNGRVPHISLFEMWVCRILAFSPWRQVWNVDTATVTITS
ncbi:MAG: hypothetical protein ACP5E5_15665 [Acidobacteriaceae bacterium]